MHLIPHGVGDCATLLGLDPGTNNLGLAWINFDPVSLSILNTQSLLLTADKMNPSPFYAETHCDRHARLEVLYENILQVLHWIRPVSVVTESPFFNANRPNAFAALIETVEMIRHAVCQYDWQQSLNYIDPPSVKRSVGAPGNAKKEVVQNHVLLIPELNYQGTTPLSYLDEHSIDAIAVAYSKLIEFRRNRS